MATMSSARTKYISSIKSAAGANAYGAGMTAFFGADVSGSGPVAAWNAKAADAEAMAAKWERRLKAVFGLA